MMTTSLFIRAIGVMNIPFTIMIKPWDAGFTNNHAKNLSSTDCETVVSNIRDFLGEVDMKFSTFKSESLVSRARLGNWAPLLEDSEFMEIYARSALAKRITHGSFDAFTTGLYDPTGVAKGWAIEQAFQRFLKPLITNTTTAQNPHNHEDTSEVYSKNPSERTRSLVEAVALNGGGDMQFGISQASQFEWNIGIENPAEPNTILAQYHLQNGAVATSGFSKRGHHIVTTEAFNKEALTQVTVVTGSITDADMWATACLAAGESAAVGMAQSNGFGMLALRPDSRLIEIQQIHQTWDITPGTAQSLPPGNPSPCKSSHARTSVTTTQE
ncbi:MAG: FAD:protein FMN transferase [Bifidobacterium aquikefiri]|uniref:FAD:protein FMN transferase n=1 Tax=Bifidobacterium aquikefiri TaxID=1653207 RepID=A0A261G8R7_9BIFI|nr:FAD:protein FMN transferase [Bifidobacterium aquikefiri]OZG67810.1 thiamine biosynthesis membrane-associated lipoprotein [Bifidobacterium aquikefiri]